jgi:Mn-containing catalase
VDARLHHLQGKTDLVTDVVSLLQDFAREKLGSLMRHQAAARLVSQYDVNNTYQYVINREEVQLSWLAKAIEELGGAVPADTAAVDRTPAGKGADAARAVIDEDGRAAQAFVDRWRPRISTMANARHAKMLGVILGEELEAKRFFDQALAGRTDLLGKRGETLGPSHGEVLASRWIE